MYFRTLGVVALCLIAQATCYTYPQSGTDGDIIASGSEVLLNQVGSNDALVSNASYIDLGLTALPSAPFAVEMRLYWRGQSLNGSTQTFFFHGSDSTFVWIGAVPQGTSVSSPACLYIVTKNNSIVTSNAIASFNKTERATTWFTLNASFNRNNCTLSLLNWNIVYALTTVTQQTFSFGFDPADVSGGSTSVGSVPSASVQNDINTKVLGTTFAYLGARVDEIRIFNGSRSFTDSFNSANVRVGSNEPNIYALWTIQETSGTKLTDVVSSRIATIVNSGVSAQTKGDIVVNQVNLMLPFYQSYTFQVQQMSPGVVSPPTVYQSASQVAACYTGPTDPTCYSFPVMSPNFDNFGVGSITFTPLRTSCGSTQNMQFTPTPASGNPFAVNIQYLPYTLTVTQTSINLPTTNSSTIVLTGTFGAEYSTGNQSIDGTIEYINVAGDSVSGVQSLSSSAVVNASGLVLTFDAGYGVGNITIKMCNQILTRPVFYPQPNISKYIPFDYGTFQLVGTNFGGSRSWSYGDIKFTTLNSNGTQQTIACLVTNNTDQSINCYLDQNYVIIQGQPVFISVKIGSIYATYNDSAFDPCGGNCKNGGQCTGLNQCDCTDTLYEGAYCTIPLTCTPNCTVHGTCTRDRNSTIPNAPNVCACNDGWQGTTCSSKVSSGKSTPVALIAGVSVAGGVVILGLAAVVVVLLIRSKNQRRGGKNFIPLHKKDFTKIIYGEQLNQDVEKSDADLSKLEAMLAEDNLEVAVAVSNITQITEADKIAKALVVVFQDHDKVLTLLQAFIAEEVNTTESAGTLFRSNSMVSKMFKFYSRLIGLPYLYETIGPELCELIEEELGLEVDPEKMEEGTDLDEMRWMLMAQSQKILKSILNNIERCPPQFRVLFAHIKRCVAERFPENVNTTIGGFIFLRFFCPAVSSPEAYGIVEEPPSASARRLLILITKVLQNLSNDVEFGSKEPYMTKMNDFIHSNRQKLSEFYDKLVKPSSKANVTCVLPKNMKAVSLSVIANHIKDNINKVENPTVKSRLESIFN